MYLPTAITVEVKTSSAIDLTQLKPGAQRGTNWNDEPILVELCPVCGKPGIPGRRKQQKTIVHRVTPVRGGEVVESFCIVKESP